MRVNSLTQLSLTAASSTSSQINRSKRSNRPSWRHWQNTWCFKSTKLIWVLWVRLAVLVFQGLNHPEALVSCWIASILGSESNLKRLLTPCTGTGLKTSWRTKIGRLFWGFQTKFLWNFLIDKWSVSGPKGNKSLTSRQSSVWIS